MGILKLSKSERYVPRIVDSLIERYVRRFGITLLYGPKWSGKTWAGARVARSAIFFSDKSELDLSKDNAGYALSGSRPRLIDEWQLLPQIWDSARNAVDAEGASGLFVFTGSYAAPKGSLLHSGTGRVGKLYIGPMTLFESGESSGTISLHDVVTGKMAFAECEERSIESVAHAVVRGGLPALVADREDALIGAAQYVRNAIDEMREVDDFDKSKVEAFLRSLARNESQPASDKTIMNDTLEPKIGGVPLQSQATVRRYMELLERFYLIRPTRPMEFNLRKSAKKLGRPKLRFFDSFFASALLGVTDGEALLHDTETFGLLFESLCIRDLESYAQTFGGEVRYYRDDKGYELDAVVTSPDLSWAGFEIKLGKGRVDEAAAKLIKLKNSIDDPKKMPIALGVIVATGKAAYKRDDGIYVIPITALRP